MKDEDIDSLVHHRMEQARTALGAWQTAVSYEEYQRLPEVSAEQGRR